MAVPSRHTGDIAFATPAVKYDRHAWVATNQATASRAWRSCPKAFSSAEAAYLMKAKWSDPSKP
ncbi:hypothetical protein [Amycolatopsis antarctica]|nr:hypothetical protein [Amycolatopsis antarctica]